MTDISVMEVGSDFLHSGFFPFDNQPRFGFQWLPWTPVGWKIVNSLALDKMAGVSRGNATEEILFHWIMTLSSKKVN